MKWGSRERETEIAIERGERDRESYRMRRERETAIAIERGERDKDSYRTRRERER